jgi:hypothetical protein
MAAYEYSISLNKMKTAGYIWKVIIGIVSVLVVLAVFSVATSKFEITALAILVLIYLGVTGFSSIWAVNHIEFSEALDNEFKAIKKLLNSKLKYEPDGNEEALNEREMEKADQEEYEKEARRAFEEKKKTIMVKFYINAAFQTVIYIIALYYLLTAIYS